MKRYKPYTFEIDFELDDMLTVEAQAVVQLPDPECRDSDVDYYGFRQITDVHVYHTTEKRWIFTSYQTICATRFTNVQHVN